MKRIYLSNWFSICCILLMICTIAACKRDKCKHVTCVNGNCVDGTCQCATGYFKDDCSGIINAGYDGTWALTESCTAGADHYDLSIAAVPGNLTQLYISGLWGKGDTVVAEIGADGYSLTIARQQIANVEITATGTIKSTQDEIDLEYHIHYLGFTQAFDVCTANATKN